MHLVKKHHCCPIFLALPIRIEEKFGPTSELAVYEHICELSKRINRQISLAFIRDGWGRWVRFVMIEKVGDGLGHVRSRMR
jgi:hypothetical protein